MIELRKITEDNFEDVIDLKLASHQENYLSPNIYSLAEAYANIVSNKKHPYITLAVYRSDEAVGFAMIEYFEELEKNNFFHKKFGDKASYYFFRFMIDEKYQGKGLGKQSALKIIEFLRSFPQGKADSIAIAIPI